MAFHRCDIRNGGYIHLDIGITPMALHDERIHYGGYIHWNLGVFCNLFIRMLSSIVL